MSDNQARRVAVEFVVGGTSHNEIMKKAADLWRLYLDDPDAALPFDTEFNVTMSEVTAGGTTGDILNARWEATVIIRQRGSNYS
jgi:hypothetical protein